MMLRIISRRTLVATTISGAAAWLGSYVSFLTGRARFSCSIVGYGELIALCSDLRCPRSIAKACLVALPAPRSTPTSLAQAILADVAPVGGRRLLSDEFAQAVRIQGRADFREGRVVTVDGWTLSLTEARVYAFAALLPESTEVVT